MFISSLISHSEACWRMVIRSHLLVVFSYCSELLSRLLTFDLLSSWLLIFLTPLCYGVILSSSSRLGRRQSARMSIRRQGFALVASHFTLLSDALSKEQEVSQGIAGCPAAFPASSSLIVSPFPAPTSNLAQLLWIPVLRPIIRVH